MSREKPPAGRQGDSEGGKTSPTVVEVLPDPTALAARLVVSLDRSIHRNDKLTIHRWREKAMRETVTTLQRYAQDVLKAAAALAKPCRTDYTDFGNLVSETTLLALATNLGEVLRDPSNSSENGAQ